MSNRLPTLRESGGISQSWNPPRHAPVRNQGTLANPGADFLSSLMWGGGGPLAAKVNELTALGVSSVFACVDYIAQMLSTLPIDLFQKKGAGVNEEIIDHPALHVLTVRPNAYMVSSDVRYSLAFNQALYGNGYLKLALNRGGQVAELYPLRSPNVSMRIENDFPRYTVASGGSQKEYGFDEILHFKGMTPDGIRGQGPVHLLANLIGLAQALEENASRFFANGSRPGMVYTAAPGVVLTEQQRNALKEQLNSAYQGVENFFRTMVLEGGGKMEMTRSANDSSQFDEIAKRTHQQICQVFRVPPHKVGILDNATFSNIEQQQIQAVADLFRPWCKRWEEVFRGALLTPQEQRTFYFRHNLDAILQADIDTRFKAHSTAIQNGFKSKNEVRRLENLNPIPGGDTFTHQANMVDINAPAPALAPPIEKAA